MKYKTVKTAADIKPYILQLAANNRAYHFDDHPGDIIWRDPIEFSELNEIISNHLAMHKFGDVWKLIENDSELKTALNLD